MTTLHSKTRSHKSFHAIIRILALLLLCGTACFAAGCTDDDGPCIHPSWNGNPNQCCFDTFQGQCADQGEIITFGHYPQATSEDEPIRWRVITTNFVDERKRRVIYAMLLSENVLDVVPYANAGSDKTVWKDSNVRSWLNNDFYNRAFSADEQRLITPAYTMDTDSFAHIPGNDVPPEHREYEIYDDKVYLRAEREHYAAPYFVTDGKATKYALDKGVKVSGDNCGHLECNATCWYRDRRQVDLMYTDVLGPDGKNYSALVTQKDIGVRPVIWIRIDDQKR